MSSDVLVSAGPRTMKIQLHLLVSQIMMTEISIAFLRGHLNLT